MKLVFNGFNIGRMCREAGASHCLKWFCPHVTTTVYKHGMKVINVRSGKSCKWFRNGEDILKVEVSNFFMKVSFLDWSCGTQMPTSHFSELLINTKQQEKKVRWWCNLDELAVRKRTQTADLLLKSCELFLSLLQHSQPLLSLLRSHFLLLIQKILRHFLFLCQHLNQLRELGVYPLRRLL